MSGAGENCRGYIDSVYCGSGVDGKGLRCVVFYSGCNLRCPFCHNPETLYKQGTLTDVDELIPRLLRYKPYFRRGGITLSGGEPYFRRGGITLSGGEPFLQKEFTLAVCARLKAEGVHVCIETNGYICDDALLAAGDLIVDVKNQQEKDLSVYERLIDACLRLGAKVEFTNVLVPGVNDGAEDLAALKRLVKRYAPQTKVRFLPFRKLCEEKYTEIGLPFPYADRREGTDEDVQRAEKLVNI